MPGLVTVDERTFKRVTEYIEGATDFDRVRTSLDGEEKSWYLQDGTIVAQEIAGEHIHNTYVGPTYRIDPLLRNVGGYTIGQIVNR